MTMSIEELNALQLDVLKEIGNIGAGNAATALAKLLNKKVDMAVPKVQILEFKRVADLLGGADNLVVGILLNVTGDLNGYIMFTLEQHYAHILVNMLMGKAVGDTHEFSEMDISALKEIGNILAGSYLSSLSTLTNLNILPSIPDLTIDMAGAILSVPAIEFGKVGDTVLFIETQFIEHDYTVVGNFFLIPDVESYDILLRALGVIS
ncbi:MAG: chemotaxis protein CheC [Petroclostridium sp.]|uniref:chemotaxis protein CheC n=1 Tax=Petroclostridium xylanilyticum TaxID=1792311 RepID=UPI000B99A1CD|nr:chemotaxis protein CheC [Petroclostridium xylanilyticum]MBZ4645885.1 CheC, inhibitor of methylation [Clostridia bacterium]MDK2809315.1 chemotaxis protein CheC [Petroclostridium sp.]